MVQHIDENKRLKIKESYAKTMLKRSSQSCFVYTLKIVNNKLNKQQEETLKMMFVEAKWLYNHILSLSNEQNVFNMSYTDINEVTHYDKDKNELKDTLKFLSSQMKQSVLKGIKNNITNLSKSKKKGNNVGKLNFIKEYKSINLPQNNISYKIISKNKIKIQGIKKPLYVNGLKQILSLECEYDLANAKLIQRNGNYYIAITVYKPKTDKKPLEKEIVGLDMGCQTSITLSNGEKFNLQIEESERLKKLHRKLAKSKKGSNNRKKIQLKLNKCYEHICNQRKDLANKIVNYLTSNYKIIMQDEQLHEWMVGHGKKISHGALGTVKMKLLSNEETVLLNKWLPTTKLCTECGQKIELRLKDRSFFCEHCGCLCDRDVHAANNMIWFYKHNIGVGRTEFTLEELDNAIRDAIAKQIQEAAESSVQL